MARAVGNGLDLQGQRIIGLADGTSPTDATTRQQLDAAIRGLDWKPEVVAGSTAQTSLTAPGTAMDGVTLTSGDRVLLKDQTAQPENGIYVWTGAAATLTRALDANSGPQLSGSTTTVQRGTVNGDRVYRVITDDPLVLGTTAVVWAQVGGATAPVVAGNGLTLTGSTLAVGAGAGILVSTGLTSIDTSVVARKFATSIGGATSVVVTHNLGTLDVEVTTYNVADGFDRLDDVNHTSINTITVNFATAPAAGAVRVVVLG